MKVESPSPLLPPRILAFSGSARRESFNRKLLAIAVREARAAGAEVTLIHLAEYPLPLFDGDLEEKEGMPGNADRLVELIRSHPALLVASPEYNSLITPLLKNTLDWCSRAETDPFPGKVAAVLSASPGPFGGVKSNLAARQLLERLGCLVTPTQCTLARAGEAFDDDGQLKDARTLAIVKKAAAELVRITTQLSS